MWHRAKKVLLTNRFSRTECCVHSRWRNWMTKFCEDVMQKIAIIEWWKKESKKKSSRLEFFFHFLLNHKPRGNVSVQAVPIIRTSVCVISSLLHRQLKLMPFISWRAKLSTFVPYLSIWLTLTPPLSFITSLPHSVHPPLHSFFHPSLPPFVSTVLLLCYLINGRQNAVFSISSSLEMVGMRLQGPIMHGKENEIGRAFSECKQGGKNIVAQMCSWKEKEEEKAGDISKEREMGRGREKKWKDC